MVGFAERGGWWVAAQAVLLAVYAAAAVLGDPVTTEAWLRAVLAVPAALLLAGAAWLAAGGVRALGSRLTPYPEPAPGAELAEGGVYGVVRHPLYGAVVLGAAGVALVLASPWAGLASLALLVFFAVKASFEERRLVATFPGYAAYRSAVTRRIIPWLF